MNGLDPDLMSAEERLDEAAEILASGFLRWRRKRVEKTRRKANVSLELSPEQRLHVSETTENLGDRP